MPERVGRGFTWLFVALMGMALVASLASPGALEPPRVTVSTGGLEIGLTQGVSMLADLVNSAWRETVQQVTKVVVVVLHVLYS